MSLDDLPVDPELQRLQAQATKAARLCSLKHIQELERAVWRMIANGQLFSYGWRLGVSVDPKTLRQTTLPIPPGDPVPAGIQRVLALAKP